MNLLIKLIINVLLINQIILFVKCVDQNQTDIKYTQKWIKILDKFEGFINPQTNQLLIQLNSVKSVLNASKKCITSIDSLLLRATKDEWALKMWDSNGRWPSGVLSGSFSEFGDYDQCLAIKGSENYFGIGGKFCFLEIRPPEPVKKISLNETKYENSYYESVINYWVKMDGFGPIANGICVPSVCTDEELKEILNKTLTSFSDLRLDLKYCSQQEDIELKSTLRFGQKVAIVIIALNVILIIIGTVLDSYMTNKDSLAIQLLICYSFLKNNKLLFKINKNKAKEGQFKYIHGLRVISIFWVLISHVYLFHPFPELSERVAPVLRLNDVRAIVQYFPTHLIINAGLAVGTFYIISGSLTIYSILPVFEKNPINIFNYALLRYLRFTPPTIGMICFIIIWPLFGSGPLFHSEFISKVTDQCYTNWWTNLLFINNWMHPSTICNNITWYMSCDFQLHLLLYFVIFFYYRVKILSKIYIFLMIFLGFAIPVIIVLTGYSDAPNPSIFLHPQNRFPIEKVGIFIFATYNQFIPYFFGVILGLVLIRETQPYIGARMCWFLWFISLPVVIVIPFLSHGFAESETVVENPLESAISFGVIRLLWSAGIAFICFECASGRAGFINKMLSSDFWQPLSRLTFTIYLIHIVPVWHNFFRIRSPITISQESLLFIAFGNAVEAVVLAYALYCLFEAPYVNLCKLLFMPSINKRVNHTTKDINENNIELKRHVIKNSSSA